MKSSVTSQNNGVRWSLKSKLILFLLLIGLTPLAIITTMTMNKVSDDLFEINKNRMVSMREEKKLQLENYFLQISGQAQTLAGDPMVVDAVEKFTAAFSQIETQSGGNYGAEQENKLRERYVHQQSNSPGAPADAANLWFPKNKTAQILQSLYISENPNPVGQKEKMNVATDNSDYSKVHKKYHPLLRDYLEKFSYYDIFLIDSKTGNVVYTVFKEVDFTANLLSGPYMGTGLGRAFRAGGQSGNASWRRSFPTWRWNCKNWCLSSNIKGV